MALDGVPTDDTLVGGIISAVAPGSIGEEVGIEPGDRLTAINGHPLRDIIDYRYHGADEELELVIVRQGTEYRIEIERDYDEVLGLSFAEPLFDGLRRCRNHCPFCFINQMPKGMRRSLYVHDDDYRYSFLLGNFITLTNLSEKDWDRIGKQHLSPLYVSIHATDTEVRRRVLGNPGAPSILGQLERLGDLRIEVHGQIVISPGVNDGRILARSIDDLIGLWPTLRTLALVPVGLTRYQRGGQRILTPEEARRVLDLTATRQAQVRESTGATWLYPSDELYLLAQRPLPDTVFYDDEAQLENGVGLMRRLLDDWGSTSKRLCHTASEHSSAATLVCGELVAPHLRPMAAQVYDATDANLAVVAVPNRFFGETVTVSGLLTGADVCAALAGRDLGRHLFLPRTMVDAAGTATLDDMTPAAIGQRLGVQVSLVSRMSQVCEAMGLLPPSQGQCATRGSEGGNAQ